MAEGGKERYCKKCPHIDRYTHVHCMLYPHKYMYIIVVAAQDSMRLALCKCCPGCALQLFFWKFLSSNTKLGKHIESAFLIITTEMKQKGVHVIVFLRGTKTGAETQTGIIQTCTHTRTCTTQCTSLRTVIDWGRRTGAV